MSLDLVNVPGAARLMAGFQVSINGRFWVSTEVDANPAMGPTHMNSAAGRLLVAQCLNRLGRHEEALQLARDVMTVYQGSPRVSSPAYLPTCQFVIAQSLSGLGRHEEALTEAAAVLGQEATSPLFGPSHHSTLATRALIAQVHCDRHDYQEAFSIVLEVADLRRSTLGADHPDTLIAQRLVARSLHGLGRTAEALTVAKDTADRMSALRSLGPNHPETAESRLLVEQILGDIEG